MTRRLVAVTLTIGVVLGAAATSVAHAVPAKAKVPKDACALLDVADVSALVPSATAKPLASSSVEVGCHWEDGREVPESLNTLNVNVVKLPVPASQIKLSLQSEAREAGAKPIKGLGDFAYQASVIPPNTEVKVLKGKLLVNVEFSGGGPVTDTEKATTLALAKQVVKQV